VTVPGREQVTRTWTRLISGGISRADAHAWAAPWVESETACVPDPKTRNALLHNKKALPRHPAPVVREGLLTGAKSR
jgi:hypothetical protein